MNHGLNTPLIKILIAKDWHIQRKNIAIYMVGGLLALSFISGGEWQFFMGTTLLISALIGLGNHQITSSIVNERKEHTLPFIMSLPVTPMDYLVAKLIANMSLFIVPWLIVCAATLVVFWITPIPNGFIPLTVIIGVYLFLCYCVSWSVGMISESEAVVIFTMVFTNCLIGPIMYTVTRFSSISSHIAAAEAVWSIEAVGAIVIQAVIILLALASAFYWQARKKTFL
ncbi:ABC-2 transporter permease [Cellvibrio mixtus]|uniref:ABC-2 transporter permease n=1 Tax=Cellvibrio mixtus TaxID=39650 RepID=UPI00058740D6|nr:ABC-2 transporter permease [Cellvibrio mixtus]